MYTGFDVLIAFILGILVGIIGILIWLCCGLLKLALKTLINDLDTLD